MYKKKLKQLIKKTILYDFYAYRDINIYNTHYSKNALISYVNFPFRIKKPYYAHSSYAESKVIAEIFREHNYNIDVYNYLYRHKINYSKYDLIFGFGYPLENSFYQDFKGLRILFTTGAHCCFENHAEMKRLKTLNKRKGILLKPRRANRAIWSASSVLSDATVVIGGEWTASTHGKYYDGPIFKIPVSAYNPYPPKVLDRNWSTSKKNFLWFGSRGLVHKGLDLCLDVFSKTPNLELHICGVKETDFFNLYNEELYNTPNIFYHGFVDISTEKFKKIVENCGFVILPSCSEGCSSSVITAMFCGCIPIVTKETSVNVGNFGFLLENLEVNNIRDKVIEASLLPVSELKRRSKSAYKYVYDNHTIDSFRENFKNIIDYLLKGNTDV